VGSLCRSLGVLTLHHVTMSVLTFFFYYSGAHRHLHSFPTRRSSDLNLRKLGARSALHRHDWRLLSRHRGWSSGRRVDGALHRGRSEEHTSELQSLRHLVCRLLLEKKKTRSVLPRSPARRTRTWLPPT